ncbi:MAG TPA: hypothetical protein DCE41_01415 [Cytophagales bacterium]|nr:hypothetical protein [Cytophagales bacterium]HAA24488.1 hypothetical protein [Cytophagales bacterium]HAP60956.1 hypothetical protein [Cytophagales bacterium]
MRSKEIQIPKFLHDIHGSKSTPRDLLLSYGGGLLAAATAYYLWVGQGATGPVWKLVLLLLISADIGAGAVANFTRGTNGHYSGPEKRKTRLVFIFSHFVHPTLFFFALNVISPVAIGMTLLVIASTLVINQVTEVERQRVVAAFLLVLLISLLFVSGISHPLLLWFFILFGVKLFLAFGIRRYPA